MTMLKVGVLAIALLAFALAPLGCGSDDPAEKPGPKKKETAAPANPKAREAREVREEMKRLGY